MFFKIIMRKCGFKEMIYLKAKTILATLVMQYKRLDFKLRLKELLQI